MFSAEFVQALIAIIIIDLVLAGDNAIVIGMAARRVPKEKQRLVIIWGTAGAILIRAVATLAVVWLLRIPGLLLVGGVLLIWIAYKLLVEEKAHDTIDAKQSMWGAIQTVIVADAVMGLDNVLAIAGAAHSNYVLVILGLLISVPIIIFGSTIILKFIEKYPVIIYIGAGVLAWTAGKMIVGEPYLKDFFAGEPMVKWGLILFIISSVLMAGRLARHRRRVIQQS